ncbi:hypothetical protein [Varunaivibrio sulfuroxidans]|uniref:Uncharacterized protein n=1 Tax=Varunaivibrio sulfuroxidans TaxID=1773489 RepID=A0A4R3J9D2_9PROT|nr:hypothetical protein [Varunaivibrio sulfuroxidans]TCS62559.1 hypothetical protein EDD55_105105 [Varunaivibrio sulfuroxidans]WES30771.1 hypothetical protein P3M64_14240 [Varunaivibrio sulfuroxidans]
MASLTNQLFERMPPPGAPVTIAEMAAALAQPNRKVVYAMDKLRIQGFAQRLQTGCYQLTENGLEARAAGKRVTSGPNGPLTGQKRGGKKTLNAKVWKALRARGKATLDDLMQLIDDRTLKDPRASAQRYLWTLAQAGYVRPLKNRRPGTAPTSNGFKVYVLLPGMNTGPMAPLYSHKHRAVVDFNVIDPATGAPQKIIIAAKNREGGAR